MQVKDTTSVDSAGNHLIWDNSVRKILSYSATNESWDRTGGAQASWYVEPSLPSDTFCGGDLSEERWSFFTYRGTVSGTVSDKLFLTISGSSARGGITSAGKWKLSGDFDIRLYFDERAYYNEYRGSASTGLTVSYDESNKFRISKYFDRTREDIGCALHYVNTYPLKYSLWTEEAFVSSVGEEEVTCFRIARMGGVLSAFVSSSVGFVQLGNDMSGSNWAEDMDVEIEVETEQFNYYSSDLLGFSVSGTLAQSKVFSSPYRGQSSAFPERSLLVVDGAGMSILDAQDMSLWMRFKQSEDYMFKNVEGNVAASNGCIYYTTSSGLLCLDFPNDRALWYTSSVSKATRAGIAQRNFAVPFYNIGVTSFLLTNEVLDVAAADVEGVDFVAAATSSGLGLLIDHTTEKVEYTPSGRVQKVELTPEGTLYWNQYNSITSRGSLFYRSSISSLAVDPASTFGYSGYYSKDTSPVKILSENISSINSSSLGILLLSHDFGMDFISSAGRVTYGPIVDNSIVQDGNFESNLGTYWFFTRSSLFNVFGAFLSSDWCSSGSSSVKLTLGGNGLVTVGNYGGIYQLIDLTGVDRLYFDFRLYKDTFHQEDAYLNLVVKVNNSVVFTVADTRQTYVSLNTPIDTTVFTGICNVSFIVVSMYTGKVVEYTAFYVDSVRTVPSIVDYSIIPSTSHAVLEAALWYYLYEHKIFFATRDGYGSIDIDSNSLDYFYEVEDYVPLSYVISAECVEYIDAV